MLRRSTRQLAQRPMRCSEGGSSAVETAIIMGPLLLVILAFIGGGFLFAYASQNVRDAGAAAIHAFALPAEGSETASPQELVIASNINAQGHIGSLIANNYFYDWSNVWMRQIANALGGLVSQVPNALFMKDPAHAPSRLTVEVRMTTVATPFASQLVRAQVLRYTPVIGSFAPRTNIFLPTESAVWPIQNPEGAAANTAPLPVTSDAS